MHAVLGRRNPARQAMSCVDRARPTAHNLTCTSPRGSGGQAVVASTTYDSLADTVTDERCRTDARCRRVDVDAEQYGFESFADHAQRPFYPVRLTRIHTISLWRTVRRGRSLESDEQEIQVLLHNRPAP